MGYSLWVLRFGSEMFPQSLCLCLGPQMTELWDGCGSCRRPGIVRNVFSNSGSYPQVCPHPFSLLPTAMSWATVLPPSFRHDVSSLPRRPESNETSQPWTELSEAVKQDEAFPPCSHLSRSLCYSNRKLKLRSFAVVSLPLSQQQKAKTESFRSSRLTGPCCMALTRSPAHAGW